jgi:hypothetical protein
MFFCGVDRSTTMDEHTDTAVLLSFAKGVQQLRGSSKIEAAKRSEVEARLVIEERCGLVAHGADSLLRANCPNIDLVIFAHTAPIYVQVTSSGKPASEDHVTISGEPWTEGELYHGEPIFNKHPGWKAGLVFMLDRVAPDRTNYYIAPPELLEWLVRPRAKSYAAKRESGSQPHSIAFRKELPRIMLLPWKNAWHLLTGDPPPEGAA